MRLFFVKKENFPDVFLGNCFVYVWARCHFTLRNSSSSLCLWAIDLSFSHHMCVALEDERVLLIGPSDRTDVELYELPRKLNLSFWFKRLTSSFQRKLISLSTQTIFSLALASGGREKSIIFIFQDSQSSTRHVCYVKKEITDASRVKASAMRTENREFSETKSEKKNIDETFQFHRNGKTTLRWYRNSCKVPFDTGESCLMEK